jgi:hypothetical protein
MRELKNAMELGLAFQDEHGVIQASALITSSAACRVARVP